MSAAKIPSIRDRMREQDIQTLELAGPPATGATHVEGRQQGSTLSMLRRTGKVARRVIDTLTHIEPTGITL
jgi:hypothetical protein